MTIDAEARAQTLRQAAQDKRARAVTKADTAIKTMTKRGQAIDFRNVARTAGVSVDFLYRNPELRARIERLRAEHRPAPPAATIDAEATTSQTIRLLTARLAEEKRLHREGVTALQAEVAALHGELLRLRRAPTVSEHSEISRIYT